ncbi:protocadherin-17 isoform X2 [Callorhinchus milii]|uniref:Protocadherin 17 n=1 Tax=Callorhinchus milii TaxID=7868 RepID=A0A4W3H3V2_CALMI|nr:protocadherin-17 isoform X2 [Callorhinchus milii]|eukprot:gi/632952058/ref/XP_007891644.1/ PREDICTED: protocadherin-17 isoform X2 [Callorhinchus milii]
MYLHIFMFLLLWTRALTLKNLKYTILEEQGPGTVIGNIAKDARLGTSSDQRKPNFRVLENSAPHLLDVDPESGLLYTKQRIDRETVCKRIPKCVVSLEVFANDKELCMIKVEILDINDNAPSFSSEQIDIEISENAAPGTRIPLTSAYDPDTGEFGLKTYTISTPNHLFGLDVKSRGDGTKFPELIIQRPLDREDQPRHVLVVTALDGGEPPKSGTMQISVKVVDSNDNSPSFEEPTFTVEVVENTPAGTFLIDVNATDPDEGTNGEVIYSFSPYVTDRIRELFSIDRRTGVITLQDNIDYEESSIYDIDVQARDLGPNSIPAHCKVSVRVMDANDNSPAISFVSVHQGAVSETAPAGTVIALVKVTDRDFGRNGQLQCRVVGNVPFKLEENYDNFFTVVTDRPLDREATDEYNLTIVARDNGSPPLNATRSFTVKVADENDNPPRFTKPVYVLQVPENNIPGEYLGSVLAHDPDLGQNGSVSYSILPSHVGDVSIYTYVSVNPANGAIYALRSFNYEQTKSFEFKVLAKDAGSPHLESNSTVRVTVLDVNDNAPVIVLPLLLNDTAEIHVPRNAGVGYTVATVRAVDNDYGESGRLSYEIAEGNDQHLFEMDPVTGEVRTTHPFWEEMSPTSELVVKVSDHGKPSLSAVARLVIITYTGAAPKDQHRVNKEHHHHWDMSLPLIVTLSSISAILLTAMVTIAVKCKRENKEIRTYNCRIAEYSHPHLGKSSKKKKISKNDIMLVQSEVEERDVMNVVSSPSLASSPVYFDYQTRLPLSSPRSEVMYLKPTSNNLTVPQGHAVCHTFSGQGANPTEAPATRMSLIQTDNFPAEPNYMGSRQQFVQSNSTFKDPERVSLRDSGHGDSDQADSDQDTNKGSCCDMSAKEALKIKSTTTKPQVPEQEKEDCVNCTDECRVLGHSDKCWMPQFPVSTQAECSDYRRNLFVPVVDATVESETHENTTPIGKKTFCTFGKDKREHTILIANVKPYLKAKRALSPLLQEVSSGASSPDKVSVASSNSSTKRAIDGLEMKQRMAKTSAETTNQYLTSDAHYPSSDKQRDSHFISPEAVATVFADVHSRGGRDLNEVDTVLDHFDPSNRDLGREAVDAEQVVREIDKLLQDCRGSDPSTVRK